MSAGDSEADDGDNDDDDEEEEEEKEEDDEAAVGESDEEAAVIGTETAAAAAKAALISVARSAVFSRTNCNPKSDKSQNGLHIENMLHIISPCKHSEMHY